MYAVVLLLAALPVIRWVNPPSEVHPRVVHRTFVSKVVGGPVGYNIYLPAAYDTQPRRRFPVIYWLHGSGGSESRDSFPAAIVDEAVRAGRVPPLVFVWVNGGAGSQYVDWADGSVRAETLIIGELIPHIDRTYRTIPRREGRAIQGMSMGASGAARLAFGHPSLFSSVVAFAGGYHSWHFFEGNVEVMGRIYGNDRDRFEDAHPFTRARRHAAALRNTAVWLIIGAHDGVRPRTAVMKKVLDDTRIPCQVTEVPGVAHSLRGLVTAIDDAALLFAARHFRAPDAARRRADGQQAGAHGLPRVVAPRSVRRRLRRRARAGERGRAGGRRDTAGRGRHQGRRRGEGEGGHGGCVGVRWER